jgi:hypothetical protein
MHFNFVCYIDINNFISAALTFPLSRSTVDIFRIELYYLRIQSRIQSFQSKRPMFCIKYGYCPLKVRRGQVLRKPTPYYGGPGIKSLYGDLI